MQIDLTDDEFTRLLILMGYATGAASASLDPSAPLLIPHFLRLANAVNRNNPRWTPYVIPEE
jgi:hypothetical protein